MDELVPDEILIENAGAIERIAIPVPVDGGVVLLLGANGTGKSTGLNVIELASARPGTNGHKERVTPRDGTDKGLASVFGITLRISDRITRKGELEVDTLEGKFDVSDLVDGGDRDSAEAADRQRFKALLQLSGFTGADPSFFHRLTKDREEFDLVVQPKSKGGDDIVLMASRIKRDFEAEQRRLKTEAERARINAEAERTAVADIVVEGVEDDPLRLQEELTLMISDREALKAKRASAVAATAAREEARRSLTEAQQTQAQTLSVASAEAAAQLTSISLAGASVALQDVKHASELALEEATRIVAEAEAALQKAKLDQAALKLNRAGLDQSAERTHALAQSNHDSALAAIEGARQHETSLNEWQKTLNDDTQIELVTDQQLTDAQLDVDAAQRSVEEGVRVRDAKLRLGRAREFVREEARLLSESDRFKKAAIDTDDVLSELVGRLPGCPLRVNNGRLVTATDRGEELFSDLSRGERYALVLQHIAVPAVGRGGLVVIRQRAWEGLDLANRRVIVECLKGTGVVAISAQCDSHVEPGELRSVIYEPPPPPVASIPAEFTQMCPKCGDEEFVLEQGCLKCGWALSDQVTA